MKTALIAIVSITAAIALGLFITRAKTPPAAPALPPEAQQETPQSDPELSSARPIRATTASRATMEPLPQHESTQPSSPDSPVTPSPSLTPVATHCLDTLLSKQSTFQQKQVAWGKLRDAGHLDQTISSLEQKATSEKTNGDIPATLGQAYLQKAGTLQDIREQGILGMKADQSFDTALELDPANWDARFWKATAMSYWPPQLGKGPELIEHCLELIRIQEARQPQPEFAQTYVLLGDQYQKEGHSDYAEEIWSRGLALFPDSDALRQKASARK